MRNHSWTVGSTFQIKYSGLIWDAVVNSIDFDCGETTLLLNRRDRNQLKKEWPNHWICDMKERAERTYKVWENTEDMNISISVKQDKCKLDQDILDGTVKIVGVKFESRNTGVPVCNEIYFFKALESFELNELVVVDTQYGFSVAKVIRPNVSVAEAQREYKGEINKCVVCKIDQGPWKAYLKRLEEKEALRQQMASIYQSQSEIVLFQQMAAVNPEMAALLEKYNKL
jgi:hypothetical protein